MKLSLPSLFGKKENKSYYLSLLFQDEQIQAVVFEEVNNTLTIIHSAREHLLSPIEHLTFDKLLATLDKAVSTAESVLPSGIQTHKTIFGLKESWVIDGQIKKEHLATLKKACEEMDLQPIGFLIFPEAISHLLQQEEGAPVSGILIEIGTSSLNATLLRAGRIVESHTGPIHEDDLPKSVDQLLAQFVDVEILPSRIIIADDTNKPHLAQSLIHHHWSKSLPFLHMPQVTPLPEGFDIRAILYGTATQMNFKVNDTLPSKKPLDDQFAIAQKQDSPKDEKEIAPTTPEEEPDEKPEKQMKEDTNEEVLTKAQRLGEENEKSSDTKTEDAGDFGFVQNADVSESVTRPTTFASHLKDNAFEQTEDELAQETFAQIPERVKEEEEGFGKSNDIPSGGVTLVRGMQKIFKKLSSQARKGNISFASVFAIFGKIPPLFKPLEMLLRGPKLLFVFPILLIAILGIILWYIFGLHATITLFINPTKVDATQPITITTKGSTDLSQNILGGTAVSVDESGSSTADATGTKDTGDSAKGSITLYNNNEKSIALSSGTTVTSSNNLKFTLDKDVTIASASGDEFSGTKPGTTNASVTARTFGTEYNLPSGTKFTTSTSGVVAKNDTAFSGGTKKSLTVISANDISKASDDLISSLEEKAKKDLLSKDGNGKTILPTFLSTTLSKKDTDKNVGDQASSVTLTATVTFESIAYSQDDLKQIANTLLKDKITDHMTLSNGGIHPELEDVTPDKSGSSAKATLKASAGLLPQVNKTAIAQRLSGKSVSQLKSLLSDINQLDSVDVVLSPNLFFLPKILPRLSNHIGITVSANE